MIRNLLWIPVIGGALIVIFSGCRSITPPVTYYTLSVIGPDQEATGGADAQPAMTIGIRPVELPGYINRTQMVRRIGPNQLKIESFHRWADYPDRLVQQLLGENLQTLLPHARVVNAPWAVRFNPDVIVSFQFLELIGTIDKKVLLSAVWTITPNAGSSAPPSQRTTLSESINGNGFEGLAAAHSRALTALCRQVAESIHAFQD